MNLSPGVIAFKSAIVWAQTCYRRKGQRSTANNVDLLSKTSSVEDWNRLVPSY